MKDNTHVVHSTEELLAALRDAGERRIAVDGTLTEVPTLRLPPGQSLVAHDRGARLVFKPDSDGLELTADHEIRGLRLDAAPQRRAMFNDTSLASLGTLRLVDVCASGQVQILARDRIRAGHVEVDGLHVIAADTRERPERPHGYGVRVVQGAFTLWNMQDDENVVITADLAGLAAGAVGKPVIGSGIFVSGAGDTGGRLVVSRLETDAVYSDARIPPGTADVISGGVFTVYGCWVDTVRNHGPVVTYGPNDMVLDNWGTVDRWIAERKITSYGPSGIGFVNFGVVNELRVERPIETFGRGARGFNVYTGTVRTAEFDRIVTHADGAVGIQISQPIGTLRVKRGIETFGGTGDSLVKGVVTRLSAIGFSVKPGGLAREVEIEGGIATHGEGIVPIEIHGVVELLRVAGGVTVAQAAA
jgi:hypothetical protein